MGSPYAVAAVWIGLAFASALVSTRIYGAGFPRGTVLINVTGSFLIAVVMELSLRTGALSEDVRLFLTTGMMGGYTTYSSFNYETLRLAEGGTLALATLNVALTVVGCLVSGVLGLLAARGLARLGPLIGSGG